MYLFILINFFFMTNETNIEYAYFGGGCFWCIEAAFEELKGVSQVTSGYAGGSKSNANYKSVSSGTTKHTEICEIKYNPKQISYETLLEIFFLAHDPTTLNKQGNDIGPQYKSIVFYSNREEKETAFNYIIQLENRKIYTHIVTELQPLMEFYPAEKYHQDYFKLNPRQPYCALIIEPKIQKLRKELKKYYPN